MKRVIAVDIIPSFLVLLFAYTAISKLADMRHFQFVIGEVFRVFSRGAKNEIITGVGVVALALPFAELTIVLLLFFKKWRLMGLYASLALLIVFTFYLAYLLWFAPYLPCSCGGVISSMGWKEHLVMNLSLIAMIIGSILTMQKAAIET